MGGIAMAMILDFLQWPAMLVTVIAVWLVGYRRCSDLAQSLQAVT